MKVSLILFILNGPMMMPQGIVEMPGWDECRTEARRVNADKTVPIMAACIELPNSLGA
jgi:hypothetical protein